MWMRVFLGETGRKYESSSGTKPSRAPLLESVGGSERLSAGDVPPLERSGWDRGFGSGPSSGESANHLFRCEGR
jgi:hypothetical protein